MLHGMRFTALGMKMVNIELKFPDIAQALRSKKREIDLFLLAQMQTNRGLLFDSEGTYNGRPGWKPLKTREGQILKKSGTLSQSIGPQDGSGNPGPNGGISRVEGDKLTIGTNLFYARMMNDGTTKMPGGVLRPKRAKALKFNIGDKTVFRKSVTIPARPFDNWNDADAQELADSLVNYVASLIK